MPKSRQPEPLPSSDDARAAFLQAIGPESPFYLLFDHLPGVSFFAKDCQFRLMCANRNFYSRFGFSTEREIVGRDDFSIFPPRLAENFRRDDEEVLRTGKPKLGIVELFFSRQGIPDWFVTNKLPVRDRGGRVIGLMGSTQSHEGNKQVLQPYLQIDRAVEWIRAHFREPITVPQLAAMVHLSPRHLHRKFVQAFGSSPQMFIMKLRIQAACEALERDNCPLSQLAEALGFSDQSSFSQHFHRHLGVTPLKYRRQIHPAEAAPRRHEGG
jgi:AraC-like DNA-binding protein